MSDDLKLGNGFPFQDPNVILTAYAAPMPDSIPNPSIWPTPGTVGPSFDVSIPRPQLKQILELLCKLTGCKTMAEVDELKELALAILTERML